MLVTVQSAAYWPARSSIRLYASPFEAEKADHGGERRQPDRALAQAGSIQPVLVELEPVGQHFGDRLVQARDEHAADSRLSASSFTLRARTPHPASSDIVAECRTQRLARGGDPDRRPRVAGWAARAKPGSDDRRAVDPRSAARRAARRSPTPSSRSRRPTVHADAGPRRRPRSLSRSRRARRHLHRDRVIAARSHAGGRVRPAVPERAAPEPPRGHRRRSRHSSGRRAATSRCAPSTRAPAPTRSGNGWSAGRSKRRCCRKE